jgi:hypothetical protein
MNGLICVQYTIPVYSHAICIELQIDTVLISSQCLIDGINSVISYVFPESQGKGRNPAEGGGAVRGLI